MIFEKIYPLRIVQEYIQFSIQFILNSTPSNTFIAIVKRKEWPYKKWVTVEDGKRRKKNMEKSKVETK